MDVDREFVRRMYDRCGGVLDIGASGEEIGRELGLDEQQTARVVARLMRTQPHREAKADRGATESLAPLPSSA